MKRNKLQILALLIFGIGMTSLSAQNATVTSGGDASGSGGSVAYSVGQVLFTLNSGETGTVLLGIQQPFEIFTVSVENLDIEIAMSVFPNPTFSELILEVRDLQFENLHYHLFDLEGRMLEKAEVFDSRTNIDMHAYRSGSYYLIVSHDQKQIQTFKIIKNN
jgi:hypothetical protein